MAHTEVPILADAIARNSGVVLSLPSAGMLRNHKSRFLSDDENGFWIESAAGDRQLIDELIALARPVGISFRAGPQKVSFTAPMLRRDTQFRVNAETIIEAIQLTFPAEVKTVQRRNNYRVRVPGDGELMIRAWRVAEHFYISDKPMATAELVTKIRDLSVGGVGLMLYPKNEEPPKVIMGERLRISIRYHDADELIIEGRVRFLPPAGTEPPIRCGVQFKEAGKRSGRPRKARRADAYSLGEIQRERGPPHQARHADGVRLSSPQFHANQTTTIEKLLHWSKNSSKDMSSLFCDAHPKWFCERR